ncbi:hypothetical protein C8R41DRAFT_499863 [Lentinula lateritia]|uniref:RING-type E3 ubiquitin transferase n=1 Tax=Lentinula lateritia TaxID=40482 RepID=A0ABQ8V8Q8_9AGAR|nr:hypothetical protein C8R41DRAFT_499863 [Lentinula lateritia]
MFPCSICKKHFDTFRALKEHARTSRSHHPCGYCERIFRNLYTLGRHIDAKHSTKEGETKSYTCRPCNRSFASQSSLVEHYRGSEAHPTCPKCGKGFENRRSFNEHQQLRGPCNIQIAQVFCSSCDMTIQKDDIFQHYLESPSHPTCHQCRVGFVDDRDFEQHCLRLHDLTRCKQCGRQYENVAQLQQHYLTSIRHPTCSACEIGFETEKRQQAHIQTIHFHSDPVNGETDVQLSHVSRVPSPVYVSQPSSPYRSVISRSVPIIENEDTLSTWTSCVFPDDEPPSVKPGFSSSGPSDITTPKAKSDDFRPYWTLNPPSPPAGALSSPEVQSPLELDALPTISPTPSTPISLSTIAPIRQVPWSQWGGSVGKAVSRPSLPRIATRLHKTPIESVKSSISTSLARDLVLLGFDKGNNSLLNTQAPDLSSPALMNDLSWKFNASMDLRPNGAHPKTENDQWYPVQPTYQKAVTRPSSNSSSTSTLNSGPYSRSSTIESPLSASTVAAVSLHCRLCMRDPCIDPTATMCGHIFCGNCITESVIVSPRCPVCEHALLLYCLFRLDLSP